MRKALSVTLAGLSFATVGYASQSWDEIVFPEDHCQTAKEEIGELRKACAIYRGNLMNAEREIHELEDKNLECRLDLNNLSGRLERWKNRYEELLSKIENLSNRDKHPWSKSQLKEIVKEEKEWLEQEQSDEDDSEDNEHSVGFFGLNREHS